MSVVSNSFEKLKRFNLEELRAVPPANETKPAKEAEPAQESAAKQPNEILEDE